MYRGRILSVRKDNFFQLFDLNEVAVNLILKSVNANIRINDFVKARFGDDIAKMLLALVVVMGIGEVFIKAYQKGV